MSDYVLGLAIWFCLYGIFSLSINTVVGYTGLLSLCHAGFAAAGGYCAAILLKGGHTGFVGALALSVVVGIMLSLAVSIPASRLRGDRFILASMALQMVLTAVATNWASLTNGPYGIFGIPRPTILGFRVSTTAEFALLCSGALAGVLVLSVAVGRSPFGRALKALREDELAAKSLGLETSHFKITAFALSAAIAAMGGNLYACYMSFIDPWSFDLWQSVLMLNMLVIGGAGNVFGPLVGSAFVLLVPEALKWAHIPEAYADNLRLMVFSGVVLFLMRRRPQGLVGEYRLT